MAALITLPNGDFIDPVTVTEIRHIEAGTHGEQTQERVVMQASSGSIWIFEYGKDRAAAVDMMQALARDINDARKGKTK